MYYNHQSVIKKATVTLKAEYVLTLMGYNRQSIQLGK